MLYAKILLLRLLLRRVSTQVRVGGNSILRRPNLPHHGLVRRCVSWLKKLLMLLNYRFQLEKRTQHHLLAQHLDKQELTLWDSVKSLMHKHKTKLGSLFQLRSEEHTSDPVTFRSRMPSSA